jgi:hypothetical protein
MALCTNMAVVVPTAISGVIRHAKKLKEYPMRHFWHFAIPVGRRLPFESEFTAFGWYW